MEATGFFKTMVTIYILFNVTFHMITILIQWLPFCLGHPCEMTWSLTVLWCPQTTAATTPLQNECMPEGHTAVAQRCIWGPGNKQWCPPWQVCKESAGDTSDICGTHFLCIQNCDNLKQGKWQTGTTFPLNICLMDIKQSAHRKYVILYLWQH